MTQLWTNKVIMVLHVHKHLTDTDIVAVLNEFVTANEDRHKNFEIFHSVLHVFVLSLYLFLFRNFMMCLCLRAVIKWQPCKASLASPNKTILPWPCGACVVVEGPSNK